MKLKALLTALCLAGVTASIALADDGHSKGGDGKKSNEHAVAASTTSTTTTTAKHDDGEHSDKSSKGTTCRPSIELELRGTVAAAPTASALALLVAKGGAQGTSLVGKQLTLDLTGAAKPATLKQGDFVRVHARACVDLVAGTVKLVASEIEVRKADAPKSTSSTTTTTSSSSSTASTTSTTAR
jgi:hypothetical protein